MFNVERDNCWKIWNDMPCAFVALDDGMDSFARALPKAVLKTRYLGADTSSSCGTCKTVPNTCVRVCR